MLDLYQCQDLHWFQWLSLTANVQRVLHYWFYRLNGFLNHPRFAIYTSKLHDQSFRSSHIPDKKNYNLWILPLFVNSVFTKVEKKKLDNQAIVMFNFDNLYLINNFNYFYFVQVQQWLLIPEIYLVKLDSNVINPKGPAK